MGIAGVVGTNAPVAPLVAVAATEQWELAVVEMSATAPESKEWTVAVAAHILLHI